MKAVLLSLPTHKDENANVCSFIKLIDVACIFFFVNDIFVDVFLQSNIVI